MDGPSTPEVSPKAHIKDRPLILPIQTKEGLIKGLLGEDPAKRDEGLLQYHRYVLDKKKKTIYVREDIHDDNDPRRNDVTHGDIAQQLKKDEKIDEVSDVVGGYVWIEDTPDGDILVNQAGSTTITGISEDSEFQELLQQIPDNDPNDPHFFIIGRNYGKK